MILHYILNYVFLLSFSALCIYNGPVMMYSAFKNHKNENAEVKLTNLKVEVFPPRESVLSNGVIVISDSATYVNTPKRYIRMEIAFGTLMYKQICRINEKDFRKCKKLIEEMGHPVSYGDKFMNSLPFFAHDSVLNSAIVNYILKEDGGYKYLAINNTPLIGHDFGLFGRIVKFIVGIMALLFGVSMPIIGTITIRNNIDIYHKTGVLPPLTDKVKGLKFLFGYKETKAEDEHFFEEDPSELVEQSISVNTFGGVIPELTLRKNGDAYLILELPPFTDGEGKEISSDEEFPELEVFEDLLSEFVGGDVIREDREVFLIPAAKAEVLEKTKYFLEHYWELRQPKFKT